MSKHKHKPQHSDQATTPAEAAAPAEAAPAPPSPEVLELREQLLRARADYANLEKRHARRLEEHRGYALQGFVETLLPGLDDLERALDASAGTENILALREGVCLAFESLQKALRDADIKRVATVGQPFDPAVHEAVVAETVPQVDRPTVVEELRAGYTLGDRVVRPARVKVAMPPEPSEGDRHAPPPGETSVQAQEGEPE